MDKYVIFKDLINELNEVLNKHLAEVYIEIGRDDDGEKYMEDICLSKQNHYVSIRCDNGKFILI